MVSRLLPVRGNALLPVPPELPAVAERTRSGAVWTTEPQVAAFRQAAVTATAMTGVKGVRGSSDENNTNPNPNPVRVVIPRFGS